MIAWLITDLPEPDSPTSATVPPCGTRKETPRTAFAGQTSEAVTSVLRTVYADMIGRRGMSVDAAKRALVTTEPFQAFPGLVAALGEDDGGNQMARKNT